MPLGLGIEDQLRQAVGAIERDRAARRAPRKLRDRRPCGPSFCGLRLGEAAQASSGSVNTTAGIARGANATFSPAITSTATRPSCDALCASIGSPTTSPMAKIDGSCGAALLVDDDEAALVDLHARPVEAGDLRVRPPADRRPARDRTAARSRARAFAFERDADAARPRPSSARRACSSSTALHRLLDALREDVDEIAIGARQQARRHLDDGDRAAERGVDRSRARGRCSRRRRPAATSGCRADRARRSNPSRADRRPSASAESPAAIRSRGSRARTCSVSSPPSVSLHPQRVRDRRSRRGPGCTGPCGASPAGRCRSSAA